MTIILVCSEARAATTRTVAINRKKVDQNSLLLQPTVLLRLLEHTPRHYFSQYIGQLT